MSRESLPHLPYGEPPTAEDLTAYEAALILGAVSSEFKVGAILSFEAGDRLDASGIQLGIVALAGTTEISRCLSESTFPEVVKRLSGSPYNVFDQFPGDKDGFERTAHEYSLSKQGATEDRAHAAHFAHWGITYGRRFNKFLGEVQLPADEAVVPGVILKMNALKFALDMHDNDSSPFRIGELREWTNQYEAVVDKRGYDTTVQHFIDEEVFAAIGRGSHTKYQLQPNQIPAVRALMDIYLPMLDYRDDFLTDGHDLAEEVVENQAGIAALLERGLVNSERTIDKRLSYPDLLEDVATLLGAASEPITLDEIISQLGMPPLDSNRRKKLGRHLLHDQRFEVQRTTAHKPPLYRATA